MITAKQAAAIVREHAQACDHTMTVLRMVADWVEATGIYDPVEDKYAIRLPGDLVRRITALTDR